MGVQALQHCTVQFLALGFHSAVRSPVPANEGHRSLKFHFFYKIIYQLRHRISSILREANLKKTLGVMSFFRKE